MNEIQRARGVCWHDAPRGVFLLLMSICSPILPCSGFLPLTSQYGYNGHAINALQSTTHKRSDLRNPQVSNSNSPVSIHRTHTIALECTDPTARFNADIKRIVSRTEAEHPNFNSVHAAEHAERMLMQMLSMYHDSGKKTARPNIESFRLVLSGYVNLGRSKWDKDNGSEVINYYTHGSSTSFRHGDGEEDDRFLHGGDVQHNSTCAVDRMEFILGELHHLAIQEDRHMENLQLNTEVLNLILKAYALCTEQQINVKTKSGDLNIQWPWLSPNEERGSYAERAEQTLRIMSQKSGITFEPDAESISYVIKAWSRQQPAAKLYAKFTTGIKSLQGNDFGVSYGEIWIPKLESIYEESSENEELSRRRGIRRLLFLAYSDMIEALSRSGVKDSGKKAYEYILRIEKLCTEDTNEIVDLSKGPLDQTEEELVKGKTPLLPTSQTLTSTILAISKDRYGGGAKRANQLLHRMISLHDSGEWGRNKPSVVAFNAVISAWAHSPERGSAGQADKVFKTMENLYFDETKPNYNHLQPDTISFNSVITAWTNSKEEAAVVNAEAYMERMDDYYNSVGSKFLDVQPDAYTYNLCISSWVRSNLGVISAKNAERLLLNMIDRFLEGDERLKPNQKIFSAVINAWAKCGDKRLAVSKAMDLIKKMEKFHDNGIEGLKPDIVAYTSCIDAIAKSRISNGAELALQMLEKVERSFLASNDPSMKPSVQTYSCVLQTLVHSHTIENDRKASEILNHMKEIGVKPNAFTLNCVINAASSVVGSDERKMESFKVALNAFSTLMNSADEETDSFTYAFFLKACLNLLPPAELRTRIATKTFHKAAKEGKVNNQVIVKLCMCLGAQEARNVFRLENKDMRNIRIHDLPQEWSLKRI
jgi:hypothetical protein